MFYHSPMSLSTTAPSLTIPKTTNTPSTISRFISTSSKTAAPTRSITRGATGVKQSSLAKSKMTGQSFDPNGPITQFSTAEQKQIEDALLSGDMTQLNEAQLAWVNQQAIQREGEIQQQLTEEQALALALAEAQAEQDALDEQQAVAIQKQKMQQYAIYGGVALLGIGLIYVIGRK